MVLVPFKNRGFVLRSDSAATTEDFSYFIEAGCWPSVEGHSIWGHVSRHDAA